MFSFNKSLKEKISKLETENKQLQEELAKFKGNADSQVIVVQLPKPKPHVYKDLYRCDKFFIEYCTECNGPDILVNATFPFTPDLLIILDSIPGVERAVAHPNNQQFAVIEYEKELDRKKIADTVAEKINNYLID